MGRAAPMLASALRRLHRGLRARWEIVKWLWRGKPSPPPHGIKVKNILRIASQHRLHTLVETGTFFGDTIAGTKGFFKLIYSIEIDEAFHHRARRLFAADRNVRLLLGDSSTVLPGILPEFDQGILFWLDAHYSGPGTGRGATETPIVAELATIRRWCKNRRCAIMIDDARAFGTAPDYPDLADFLQLVESQFQAKPSIIDDAIVVIPDIRAG